MVTIKTSQNVEFDVIYADGTRHRVTEGVLFEAEGSRLIMHIGTNRAEVVLGAGECAAEWLNYIGASFATKWEYLTRVLNRLMKKKVVHSNGV